MIARLSKLETKRHKFFVHENNTPQPADAVYLEGYIGESDEWATFDKYFDDKRSVQAAEGTWDRLLTCAYPIDQSRDYIESLG